jgi:hypothetical protein
MSNRIISILCEEVRDEVRGTRTLVGVFPTDGVKIPAIPFIIPKFAVFVSSETEEIKEVIIEIELFDPTGKSLFKISSPKIKSPGKTSYFAVNISPIQIKQSGIYSVKIKRKDGLETDTNLRVTIVPQSQTPTPN